MPLPRLTAAQAAARLGVKTESLYAYVSRGQLTRERTAAGSTFDPLEVEVFAQRRRREPAPGRAGAPSSPGAPLMVLDTDIALIEDDELFFRGRPARDLTEDAFLSVAAWLWGVDAVALRPPDGADRRAARRAVASLPGEATVLDRIAVAVIALAATDPLRNHPAPEHLARVGGRLLTGIPSALGDGDGIDVGDVPRSLWDALSAREPGDRELRALESALVLLVDHDLAVSTLAARIAASARGSGYAVVTAALGAFGTPLHGTASGAAAVLLRRVLDGTAPATALAEAVASDGRGVPGFGQPLYAGGDARAGTLFERVRELEAAGAVCAAVDDIVSEVQRRADLHPNIDLALAALTIACGMADDAGAAVFAVGRMVGWIAHAVSEYGEKPMRLRPRGRYVGPA